MRTPSLLQIQRTIAALVITTLPSGVWGHIPKAWGQTTASATAPTGNLSTRIAAMIAEPAVARARWGVVVTSMDGSPIIALHEGQLFQPASNTKLFTTAAALALLKDATFKTTVVARARLTENDSLDGDLVLVGDGDAYLSGRPVPYAMGKVKPAPPLHSLEEMADAVAASGLKIIHGDIIGDDTLFPFEPYPIDWAIDDTVWGYGAPVSALTINDNQIRLTVKPGAKAGAPAEVTLDPGIPYYTIDTSALTTAVANNPGRLEVERNIGSKIVRIYGSIAVASQPDTEEIAIDDPAEYAAVALKTMLAARGITVLGSAHAKHRTQMVTTGFLAETREPVDNISIPGTPQRTRGELDHPAALCKGCEGTLPADSSALAEHVLASHDSATVLEDVVITNKESQNLHAELLLHQLGASMGSEGSTAQGARVVRSFAITAGIDPADFVFYDGSGLSGHDLVTPRAIARMLYFAAAQPWFATYKASLPIGGIDGTLESRFTKAPLKGHVFAKTGSNSETRALSGYLDCASGRTVIFSILDGNHTPGSSADREVMDRIVAAIAAAN